MYPYWLALVVNCQGPLGLVVLQNLKQHESYVQYVWATPFLHVPALHSSLT